MKATQSVIAAFVLCTVATFFPDEAAGAGQIPGLKAMAMDSSVNGMTVDLPADSMLELRLPANPSTGYVWEVESPLKPEASVRMHSMARNGAPEFEDDGTRAPGEERTQVLRFVGQRAGVAWVKLVYHRPWEKAPADKVSFAIRSGGGFKGTLPAAGAEALGPGEMAVNAGEITAPGLPVHFNWAEMNGASPVKDQGQCGGCWAFGAVAAFESQVMLKDKVTPNYSEQYLVSCNYDGWGCSGGWWAHDYHWYAYVAGEYGAGARNETDFPYGAYDYACNPPHTIRNKLDGWAYTDDVPDGRVPYYSHWPSTAALKQKIYDHGPVATTVCSTTWSYYTGGVFRDHCGYSTHIVLITGWDDTDGAFIIKNSWGTGWGEKGYIRLAYGYNLVGYLSTYLKYKGSTIPKGPTAEANGPYNVQPGATLTFSSAGSSDIDGTIASYLWEFGDGTTSAEANPVHTYATEGTYLAKLTVTDNSGLTGNDTAQVYVTAAPFISTETEPNRGFPAANGPVGPGFSFTGAWAEAKDSDYFYFDVTALNKISIRVDQTGTLNTSTTWQLYHESDLTRYVAYAMTSGASMTGSYTPTQVGRYYLIIYTYGNAGGSYRAKVAW